MNIDALCCGMSAKQTQSNSTTWTEQTWKQTLTNCQKYLTSLQHWHQLEFSTNGYLGFSLALNGTLGYFLKKIKKCIFGNGIFLNYKLQYTKMFLGNFQTLCQV